MISIIVQGMELEGKKDICIKRRNKGVKEFCGFSRKQQRIESIQVRFLH